MRKMFQQNLLLAFSFTEKKAQQQRYAVKRKRKEHESDGAKPFSFDFIRKYRAS